MNRVTWWGHATVEIVLDGVRLLTDPLLTRVVGPLVNPAPVPDVRDEPPYAVLVSHLHQDHLHLPSLRRLPPSTRLIVPRGAGQRVARLTGRTGVEELAPGERAGLDGVTVVATPARHGDRRAPWSGWRASPLGFLVEGSSTVYFAGDTDLFAGMADLAPAIDLALLPVGGWGPTLGPGHLDPARAAEALRLVRPAAAVPVHWGTLRTRAAWRLNAREYRAAGSRFRDRATATAPEVDVTVLRPGESVHVIPSA